MNSITITNHIESRWKDYANYIIKKRGIPSFYDGLTNVQRVLISAAPQSFTKSVSVVGYAISKGYLHGNSSLEGSLNGLAKEFGSADRIFIGDGFFGSPVSDEAAAARYTAVKLNKKFADKIKRYENLNKINEEGFPEKFNVNVPIGAVTGNTGIAIGFKSQMLPRRIEDIEEYFSTGKEPVPYFEDFDGKVYKSDKDPHKWIIEGKYNVKKSGKTNVLTITEIPPTIKYSTFIDKINKFLEKHSLNSVKIKNESKTKINLILRSRNTKQFAKLKKKIASLIKSTESENIVFIKDDTLVQYDTFTDYLDDFGVWVNQLDLMQMNYELDQLDSRLLFLNAKVEFMKWMLQKKRTRNEIVEYLSGYPDEVSSKLRQFPLYKLDEEEINETKEEIRSTKKEITQKKRDIKKQEKIVNG